MKKIIMLVALAALAFTSCMKEDETFKRLEPVMPGMNIYNGTMTMHRIAMQPADMAVRLAIVIAEAYKQDPTAVDPDLTKIKVNEGKDLLFEGLMGQQVTLTKTDDIYKLVFDSKEVNQFYMSDGTMSINTKGLRLDETSQDSPWVVSLDSDYAVLVRTTGGYNTLQTAASVIELYRDGSAYQIVVQSLRANIKDKDIRSNWNSSLRLTPPSDAKLAYSDIKGKRFGVTVKAEGPSCLTFDNRSSTELSLEIKNGMAEHYLAMTAGTAICKLTGVADYNTDYYKAREAEVKWLELEDKLVVMLTYNNITENVTGYLR